MIYISFFTEYVIDSLLSENQLKINTVIAKYGIEGFLARESLNYPHKTS